VEVVFKCGDDEAEQRIGLSVVKTWWLVVVEALYRMDEKVVGKAEFKPHHV
jgi:hypothetical protein